jgi:Rod binding domain-containing protein
MTGIKIQSTMPLPAATLAPVSRPISSANGKEIATAAQDFEAMAIGQLLQPMFDTVDSAKSEFGGGAGEEAWKPMLIQEIAKHIAVHGGLGLADPIAHAMQNIKGNKAP